MGTAAAAAPPRPPWPIRHHSGLVAVNPLTALGQALRPALDAGRGPAAET